MKSYPLLLCAGLALAGCSRAGQADHAAEIAALRGEVAAMKAAQAHASGTPTPELGQQMLNLQIRHGRLWAAGDNGNWLLAQFELAELNEALSEVVEQNGDHSALQPQRLADVLPQMMKPALGELRAAIDAGDRARFAKAYDGLSAACTGCHRIADHGFLVIQRPRTPVLDNLRAQP
jgi:hypothetical protein